MGERISLHEIIYSSSMNMNMNMNTFNFMCMNPENGHMCPGYTLPKVYSVE